jgi:hypothetical protein
MALLMIFTLTPMTVWAIPEPEVQIGDTGYATLEYAINAADDGDEIVFLSDITIDESKTTADDRLVIDKDITINFGQYKLIAPGSLEPTSNWAALYIQDADVTLKGSTGGIDCLDKDSGEGAGTVGPYCINLGKTGAPANLTIESGVYHGGGTIVNVQLGTVSVK